MFEIKGRVNTAICYAKVIENEAIEQIRRMCDYEIAEGSKIRIMPDAHAGKGCTIGTTMTISDKVVPLVVGVDIGCLDADTEFITEHGFKKISEYKPGDKVLQYEPRTDKATFVEPYAFIDKPCDKFYHFKNSEGLDQMVSEEHRMLVYKGYKGKGYKRIVLHPYELCEKNLDKGYLSFKASYSYDGPGVDMTDDELRLRVALCADGRLCYSPHGLKTIDFHFSKERKIKRLRWLLEKLNMKYSEKILKDGTTSFYLDGFKNNLDKFEKTFDDLYMASHHQLEIITEECLLWDEYAGYRSFFSSNDKSFADFIQFAFSGVNKRAGISVNSYENKNWNPTYYNVIPTLNEYVAYSNYPEIVKRENMRKYCFVVPSSYFVIRRNNQIAITGNCGMYSVNIGKGDIDFERVDAATHYVPSGMNVWDVERKDFDITRLRCFDKLKNPGRLVRSLGTLGGGNHFVEVDRAEDGTNYLVIHSGSRNLGKQVAEYYQWRAVQLSKGKDEFEEKKAEIIKTYCETGRQAEIQEALWNLREEYKDRETTLPEDLCYVYGQGLEDYLHDVVICQEFARRNREEIAHVIMKRAGLTGGDAFHTVHNYIDTDEMILRKGAIAAHKGETVLIPINMRDGAIIAKGRGNPDWNYSAPHGAGRLMSRKSAKAFLDMDEYRKSMEGIYTTSVSEATLDEAPMAYKSLEDIIDVIRESVDIVEIIKPIYNFKAE